MHIANIKYEVNVNVVDNLRLGINAVPLLSPWTGIGQYTYHLTKELQALLSHQPQMFYAAGWSNKLRTQPLPTVQQPIKKFVKRFIPSSYHLSRFIQQHRFSAGASDLKIMLYHEPNFVSYRFSGPTVITVHDLSYIRYSETHPIERIKHMDKHMPHCIETTQHIIVDSEFVKHEVMDYYGVPEHKITTTYLGVSSIFTPQTKEECLPILQKYGLEYGHYFLAVGALEPRKNIGVVLNAFSQLSPQIRKHFPLVVVGMKALPSTDALTRQLADMVQKGEVIMPGYVAQDHLPKLYSGARLFVYPSIYEGFGLPPLEAMSCGTPVLVSNCSSLPEVVGEAGVLIHADDVDNWSHWIRRMIEDEDLNKKHSALGMQQAKLFSWKRCAEQTMVAYERALNG